MQKASALCTPAFCEHEIALLYRYSPEGSEEEQLATRLLLELMKRSDLTIEEVRNTGEFLYRYSPTGSEAQLLATTLLLKQLSHTSRTRDDQDVYPILREMVPQFHKLQ